MSEAKPIQVSEFRVKAYGSRFIIRYWRKEGGEWAQLWSRPRATLDGVSSCLCMEVLGYKPGGLLSEFVREDILDSMEGAAWIIPQTRVLDSIARGAEIRLVVRAAIKTRLRLEKKDSDS